MNKVKTNTFDDILKHYIFKPDTFWPDDKVFHRRNREKLVKARTQVKELDDDTLLARLKKDLDKRYQDERKTLYVISCGSSGCHFLGEMLSSIGNFDLIKEVYYPPELLWLCREGELSEKERMMLFDLVSYFPSKGVKRNNPDIVPVNIMHLRPDTPTGLVKDLGGHHVVLLMRNPFDIAYSRTFRKEGYREEVNPYVTDKEYLMKQIRTVKNFYRMIGQEGNIFDSVVRYEDLVTDPFSVVHDLLFVMKNIFPDAWHNKKALPEAKNKVGSNRSINYNQKKKESVGWVSDLMKQHLCPLSKSLGYDVPSYLR